MCYKFINFLEPSGYFMCQQV